MRNFKTYSFSRSIKFSLLVFLSVFAVSAYAQYKDILLYQTDFQGWDRINNYSGGSVTDDSGSSVSSSDLFSGSGDGEGFYVSGKPAVSPDGTIGTETGFVYFDNSSTSAPNYYMTFKPLTFISGGALEVEFYANTTSERIISIPGATLVSLEMVPSDVTRFDRQKIDDVAIGTSGGTLDSTPKSGSRLNFRAQSTGLFRATFYFPSTFTGEQTIYTETNSKLQDIAFTSIKVYSGVGTTPYVASTNYAEAPATGLVVSAILGGADEPGTVDVQAWNISGSVKLSIEGEDAARFSLPVDVIDNSTALAGTSITVNYSPSVKAGSHSALLKIEDATGTADPYYVKLVGTTASSTGPEITTSTSTVMLWTYTSGTTTKTVTISGVNLTGDVSISIEGTNIISFDVSESTVSASDALAGYDIEISYEGANSELEETAELVLTSSGASEVRIPIVGVTDEIKQTLQTLKFYIVDENGDASSNAYVETDIVGPEYKTGTKVTATVTLEDGYKISYWQDNLAISQTERSFTVGNVDFDSIFIKVIAGTQVEADTVVLSGIYAFEPTNIEENSFDISWTAVTDAISYTITVYDEDGVNVVLEYTTPDATTTSYTVSSLASYTLYRYTVDANFTADDPEESLMVGPYRTAGTPDFNCGQ